ncbi:hypothetical protein ACFLV7_04195 [Chloroflexota bacterium]
MNNHKSIKLKAWNPDSHRTEETGETISAHQIAKSMTLENFAVVLDDFLNLGGKGFREGKLVGLQMHTTHRTLQRLVICFAFGLIAGLSEQEYTDPRNETAIQTAKKIAKMIKEGELRLGPYI